MNSFSDKSPPPFVRNIDDFNKWLRKFKLWLTITEVDKKKHGALLLLRLDDDTQDRINELMKEVKRDINKQIKDKKSFWREWWHFWPLSVVVPIMLLSIMLGPIFTR